MANTYYSRERAKDLLAFLEQMEAMASGMAGVCRDAVEAGRGSEVLVVGASDTRGRIGGMLSGVSTAVVESLTRAKLGKPVPEVTRDSVHSPGLDEQFGGPPSATKAAASSRKKKPGKKPK